MKSLWDLVPSESLEGVDRGVSAREAVEAPVVIESSRTDVEDAIGALMPGDDVSDHPLRHEAVEYMDVPFSELLGRLERGGMDIEEERKVRRALAHQRAFHQCGTEVANDRPKNGPSPPKT